MPPSRSAVKKADSGTRSEARTSAAVADGWIDVIVTPAPSTFTVRLHPSSDEIADRTVFSRACIESVRPRPDFISGAVSLRSPNEKGVGVHDAPKRPNAGCDERPSRQAPVGCYVKEPVAGTGPGRPVNSSPECTTPVRP